MFFILTICSPIIFFVLFIVYELVIHAIFTLSLKIFYLKMYNIFFFSFISSNQKPSYLAVLYIFIWKY